MPLVEYIPDKGRYEGIFSNQVGYGPIIRYRGSHYQSGSGFFPQVLKNVFAKIVNFTKPIIAAAAPHAKAAVLAAQPHLREAATGVVKETTDRLSKAIANKLVPQEGSGRKRKKKTVGKKSLRRSKKLRRIPPLNIPDFY